MPLTNKDIITRIDKLQQLMYEVDNSLTCTWEEIVVEKIKDLFERGLLSGGKHMQFLNKLYKDYKHRKDLEPTDKQVLNYRKWDLLFSEDKHDELMYKLRYEYVVGHKIGHLLYESKKKIKEIKRNLEDLSVPFDYDTDIMRIRINKKSGDLVMVENPFDNNHKFPAVITSSNLETAKQYRKSSTTMEVVAMRCEIEWKKQDDEDVTGSATLTEYDINTNNTLFAENITNLT